MLRSISVPAVSLLRCRTTSAKRSLVAQRQTQPAALSASWKAIQVQTRSYASRKKKVEADAAEGEPAPKKTATGKAAVESLEAVIKKIEQSFGAGTVMKLDPNINPSKPVEVVSTGSLSLDIALGVGGLPKGRIIEIFGPESSGKTTLALQVIAQAQAKGEDCCFIDAEHALDVGWAKKLGVNTDRLLVCQPDSGEQALEIADTLVHTGSIGVIVIDSVAALVPRQELEGEMGQQQIGLQARLMSQALRKLTPAVSKANCIVIFINQIRMKIGVMFGNPETTSGGVALKYYASVRLDIRKIGSVKKGDVVVANQMRVKVGKNKVAPPFRTAEFDIEFGKGLSKSGEIIDIGLKEKIIEKSGTWYSVVSTQQQLGQGREKAKQFLEENPDVSASLEKAIRDVALSHKDVVVPADGDAVGDDEGSIDALLDSDAPAEGVDRA